MKEKSRQPLYKNLIIQRIQESIEVKKSVLQNNIEIIDKISRTIINAYKNGKKVILFGNGGSAADAQHIAAELGGKFYLEREGLSAESLTVNTSTLTAIGNDYSFSKIFSRQLESIGMSGDVAIGISTSGNAENVIQALRLARKKGLFTVGLIGKDGGKMRKVVDLCLRIPSNETPRIQESHIMVGHLICEIVERDLFGDGNAD